MAFFISQNNLSLFFFLTSSDTITGSDKGCHHHKSQVEGDVCIVSCLRRCCRGGGRSRSRTVRRTCRRLCNRLCIRLFCLGVRYRSLHSCAVRGNLTITCIQSYRIPEVAVNRHAIFVCLCQIILAVRQSVEDDGSAGLIIELQFLNICTCQYGMRRIGKQCEIEGILYVSVILPSL